LGLKKTRMISVPDGGEKFDDMYNGFDTNIGIGQTDGDAVP